MECRGDSTLCLHRGRVKPNGQKLGGKTCAPVKDGLTCKVVNSLSLEVGKQKKDADWNILERIKTLKEELLLAET